MLVWTGGLYVLVNEAMGYDASSDSRTATWALNDSVIGGPPFISGYKLNFSRLNIIIEGGSFSFFRYASNSLIFLDV